MKKWKRFTFYYPNKCGWFFVIIPVPGITYNPRPPTKLVIGIEWLCFCVEFTIWKKKIKK
jgi:hypothetical protein